MAEQIPSDSDSKKSAMENYDVLLWPDNTWCYAFEFPENAFRGTAFRVVPYFNAEWLEITDQMPF